MVTQRREITKAKTAIAIMIEEPIFTDVFANPSPPKNLTLKNNTSTMFRIKKFAKLKLKKLENYLKLKCFQFWIKLQSPNPNVGFWSF